MTQVFISAQYNRDNTVNVTVFFGEQAGASFARNGKKENFDTEVEVESKEQLIGILEAKCFEVFNKGFQIN